MSSAIFKQALSFLIGMDCREFGHLFHYSACFRLFSLSKQIALLKIKLIWRGISNDIYHPSSQHCQRLLLAARCKAVAAGRI